MAKKISQLTQATEVKSDDVTVIVQDGETKKLPLNMMVTKQDIENKKVAGLAKLDEIEATYENDTYTPTITVKNKSSVKVGEGDGVDYSANVMDGHAKSAILKGQTLVNKMVNATYRGNPNDLRPNSNMEFINTSGLARNILPMATSVFEPNKTHTIILFLDEIEDGGLDMTHTFAGKNATLKIGANKTLYTTPSRLDDNNYSHNTQIQCNFKARYMVLDGDYTNVDIPYFTDMQSVKMPVLTTNNSNLAMPSDFERGYINESTGQNISGYQEFCRTIGFINVKGFVGRIYGGAKYNDTIRSVRLFGYDKDKKFVKTSVNSIDVTSDIWYIRANIHTPENPSDPTKLYNIYISSKNSYEPHKSNILTVNEEVTLRGIGGVKDELNVATRELTQRIGEIVLDGTQSSVGYRSEYSNDDYYCFIYDITKNGYKKAPSSPICLSCPIPFQQNRMFGWETPKEFVLIDGNELVVKLLKSKLNNDNSISSLNTYLASNPITINYPLKTESVKTVDLMPSGTHPSTTPYCWKNGHIQLSSSGLLPNLEYSVVTSRAGQINQNATMIVKNDKRIFDLEILLAGGLVNTTYQALTLQNQVETGLSKVSLNSETEPDYLLYHMIMKLIEEKAYKLDDLTEKVSVFYLYEKLSDEQFETIYSALYPFVEDEIVEEPVVEELPEVVEDEVIM